jgi:hypothetical protein
VRLRKSDTAKQFDEIHCLAPFNEAFWSDFGDHHLPDFLLTPLLRIERNPIPPGLVDSGLFHIYYSCPRTWAMLLLGFAGIGYMAYRRKTSASFRVT